MIQDPEQPTTRLSLGSVFLIALLAGGLLLGWLTGPAWAPAAAMAVSELGLIALVIVAAGGYGHLAVRRLAPRSAPTAFRAASACALGLWLLSTAVLVAGSAAGGLLTPWVWWPVVAVGVVLAGWQGRKAIMAWDLPRRAGSGLLFWLLLSLVLAIWLAGAVRPPGYVGRIFADKYDVLEYHLQVPREFFAAGRVGQLQHNCYSYYPLGAQMLFLLGMCLRGGAYEGMYLAKLLHGTFGALAAVGIFAALREEDARRARFSAGILAATPVALYLSWLAMVELAQVCYLVFAVLWMRQWLRDDSPRSALLVGLMLGAACAVKYLSVLLAAGPVFVMMLVCSLRNRRRALQVPLAALAALLPAAPWLARNAIYTSNPFFPLATRVFGRAHWNAESQQRWTDGHAPGARAPVPKPPGWERPPGLSRITRLYYFLISDWFGKIPMVLVAAGICILFASRGPPELWEWSLVGLLVLQVAAWALFTHDMPLRFIVVAIVPISLLCGGVLCRLSRVEVNPFRKRSVRPPHGPWGQAPAGTIFFFAVGINLIVTYNAFRFDTVSRPVPPWPGDEIALRVPPHDQAASLPPGSRILLVGESRAFYFPARTSYATAFDSHPLAQILQRGPGPRQVLDQLRAMGITHIWVDWQETWRLAGTYGYPAVLTAGLYERWQQMRQPGLDILDRLAEHGLSVWDKMFFRMQSPTQPSSGPASAPARRPPKSKRWDAHLWHPSRWPRHWPVITIYAMPGVRPPAGTQTADDGNDDFRPR